MCRHVPTLLIGLCIGLIFVLTANVSNAQLDSQRQNGKNFERSLDFVPANASFYWSSQNNRKKWNAIIGSRAFQELINTRAAKELWKTFLDGFQQGFESELDNEDTLTEIKDWFKSEDGRLTVSVLTDAFSDEVFLFGDEHWADAFARTMSFYGKAFQYGMANPDLDDNNAVNEIVWKIASEEFAGAEIPAMLVGGKLADSKQAKQLLLRLYDFIQKKLDEAPAKAQFLKKSFRKVESANGVRLVFSINGNDIPWESLADKSAMSEDAVAASKKWWEDKSIVLSLGVEGQFITFGSAPSEEFFTELGNEELLAESSVLEPMMKHKARPISSIFYLSNDFVRRASNAQGIGEYYSNIFKGVRRETNDFDGNTELADAIESDLEEFAVELKEFFPEPGAYLEFSFLTDQGIEGYSYDWSENISFDGSKKLTILEHVGGDPAFLLAGRSKDSVKEYEFLTKYGNRFIKHAFDFLSTTVENPDDQKRIAMVNEGVTSILKQLDATSRENLLPSLKNQQSALIVDFNISKKSWFSMMPPADDPLPIPSLAMLLSVSDAELFKSAIRDYFDSADSVVELLREFPEVDIPTEFVIPRPEQESIEDGIMYFYGFPDMLGIDEELMPNMSLNKKIIIMALTPLHSRRLMTPTPLTVGGPLADPNRPLMFAVHYNNRATIDVIEQWTNYGLQLAFGLQQPEDFSQFSWRPWGITTILSGDVETKTGAIENGDLSSDAPRAQDDEVEDLGPADFIELGQKTIAFLKRFEGYTAAGYMEDDAQVTHFLYRFNDAFSK